MGLNKDQSSAVHQMTRRLQSITRAQLLLRWPSNHV